MDNKNGNNISQLEYDCALVVKKVPNSAINGLSLSDKHGPVDVERAQNQHEKYVNTIKSLGLEVFELDANEIYPDCVFVEDTAIAINNRILITNPGAQTRRGETQAIRKKFNEIKEKFNLEIIEMKNTDEAFIDGGDCLFTGRELIIGISSRTNLKGIAELESAFEGVNVIKCHVKNGLHLKCFLTMIQKDKILIGVSETAQLIREQIKEQSKYSYDFVEIDEDENGSANVLLINDSLLFNTKFKHLYEKLKSFQFYENMKQAFELENDELEKIDGALTCRSILFRKGF